MSKEMQGGVYLPGHPAVELAAVLDAHADTLLIGKKLPSYAKTNRPSSDDKRIEFLSKVLAGARLGLAPITAAKRLSHWHWPRNWAEKPLKEYIEWSKDEFSKQQLAKARNSLTHLIR